MTDQQLLEEYAARRSEAAFAELVERHKDWVYSSCLRRLGDPAMAEDATQVVFITLARKAGALQKHRAMAGWLYRAAKFTALNMRKSQTRRATREAEGAQMVAAERLEESAKAWTEMAPGLEAAMDRLPEKYRMAVLLRFYQKKSHGEIGAILGISTDNARKRVERGVERLREKLVPASGAAVSVMSAALLAHGVEPGRMRITATELARHVAARSGASWIVSTGVLRMMYWAKMKMVAAAVVAVIIAGAAGVTVVKMKPAVAADGPAAATTAPAAGDPIRTLEKFNQAFVDMDAAALPGLVDTRDREVVRLVQAIQERMTIVARLRHALKEKKVAEKLIAEISDGLTGGTPFSAKELASSKTAIDGDAAVITRYDIDPPASVMLLKVDGKWKIDLATVLKKAMDGGMGAFQARLEQQNPLLTKMAGKVEKGELAGEDFPAAFKKEMDNGRKLP